MVGSSGGCKGNDVPERGAVWSVGCGRGALGVGVRVRVRARMRVCLWQAGVVGDVLHWLRHCFLCRGAAGTSTKRRGPANRLKTPPSAFSALKFQA